MAIYSMVTTPNSVPRQALFLGLTVVVLELVAGSHFRGAIIQWRPVEPVNFDGRIIITHRIAWQRSSPEGGNCDAGTVAAGTLLGGGSLTCRSGCSGDIGSLQYQCTDFSVDEDWSAGQGNIEMDMSSVENFEASYTGGTFNWPTLVEGGGNWEVRVKGNLSPRADNGRINSSPTTAVSPLYTLRHSAIHTITIPVSDADGDVVRCRWAESAQGECGGVCQVFPATLDQDNCRLTYNASGSTGFYAVAIQVEDFISSSSTVAMSSVPVQFLVQVQSITVPPNITPPTFVGTTPEDGSCVTVGSTYQQQITARSGGDGAIIAYISTVSPPGLMRSNLTICNTSQESYINVTWTPSASQQGANIFCYTATDNFGVASQQRCITLVVGVAAPQLTSVALTSFRNGIFGLFLQYDQQIEKPFAGLTPESHFVRVFQDDGVQVLLVDVANSTTDAVYSGVTLTITTNTSFLTTKMYYLLADPGVAVAAAFCALESPAVTSPSEWPFGVTDTGLDIIPASGSLSGGTVLTLSGSVLYEADSTNQSSVAVDIGGIPCAVLLRLNTGVNSSLTCTTREYPNAQEGQDSPPLTVTVTLNSNQYQLNTSFTYSWNNTPQIHYMDPSSIPVGHLLGFTGINLPTDPRDIEAVFIGEQPCDLINASSNQPYGNYTREHTDPFVWIQCLPQQMTPGVYNVSVVVGNGVGRAWRHSNSKYYGPGGRLIMLEVFADVLSVQPTASHLDGGELITITGVGFSCGMTVDIDGVPCEVMQSSFSEIKCVTGAAPAGHPAVSEDGSYPSVQEGYRFKGGRGVTGKVYLDTGLVNDLNALYDASKYPDNPDIYFIYPSYQPEHFSRYDGSGEISQAFFTPQESTTYVLWLEADNEGELLFGRSANITNVTRIGYVPHYTEYPFGTALVEGAYLKYDSQRADAMELVAGESYLILGAAKEVGGEDYIRAMALLPNSTYMKNESGWVIQDEPGWPDGYFMRPLPGFMLQSVEETPQIHLSVNGLLASCLEGHPLFFENPSPYNACSFVYRNSRPRITRSCPNTWELSWNTSILRNTSHYTITLEAEGSETRMLNVTGNDEQPEGLTVVLPTLSLETEYTATITGTMANGTSLRDSVVFYTQSCVSSAPMGLSVTAVTNFGFNLEWNPPSSPNGNIQFYQVILLFELADNDQDLPEMNPVNVSSTAYNYTGLAAFTRYSVQVCAYTIGCGEHAILNVTTLAVLPQVSPSDGVTSKPIKVGEPVTISFTVVNEPVPTVTREGIQWELFTLSNNTVTFNCTSTHKYTFSNDCLNLTVHNTEGSDAGLYQIVLPTEAGVGMGVVQLAVSEVQPEVVIPLVNATLPQGSSHMFVCAAVADPRPVLVFRFNGEQITSNSSKHSLVTNSTHSTLTVLNLQGSDDGKYSCSASNRYGSVTTAAVLSVQVPPKLTFFPSAVRDAVRGESLVASCQANGNPSPVVQWFRGDQLLNGGNQSRISVSQDNDDITTSSELTVTGFESEDVGVYSCVAVNSLGNDSRSFQGNAVVRPNITNITSSSEEQALFNGGMLTLVEFTPQLELICEAYGVPPPEVVWLKDGIALQNLTDRRVITAEDGGPLSELGNITTSRLRLSEVQLSDAGEYTCRATSGNVSPIPGTTAWIFTFEVTELDDCDPNPCLNNGECVDGVQNYTCNCAVSNDSTVPIYFTGRNCSIEVDNQEAPSIISSPSNVTVKLSDKVTLSCTASGNPTPSIQWYKDNKTIEGPQAIGDTLVIPEATPDERGFYHCEAFSSFGSPSRSTEAVLLISGIVQFRIEIVSASVTGAGSRRKRQATSSIVEDMSLQMVNQPLPVEGNLTATVYSVEAAVDNSSEIVITISTDSTESPATLTSQVTQPLEQTLEEVTDINEQISFAIVNTERHDGCPVESLVCGNAGLITWPETEIGQEASIPCPCGVSDPLVQELRGTRRCGGTYDTGAVWEEPQCDSCLFSNTRLTLCQLDEVDSPAQLAYILVNVTDDPDEIESVDVSLTVDLLSVVANSIEDLQQEDVQRDSLSIVSNLQQVSREKLAISQERTLSSTRIFEFVEMVLNFVEVAPGNPFQYSSPEFGVLVEDPLEDFSDEGSFTPNLVALLSQVMNSTAANTPMEEIPELPPATVTLASAVLTPDNNGTRPRISVTVYGRDSLFQQRPSFIASNNLETEIVGSIVVDISLRQNGSVTSIVHPPNSNIVIQNFTKSMLARNNGSNTFCQFWNLIADDGYGAWDSRSCRVLRETAEEVDCGCDHLTHFAILLDINPNPGPPDANDVALTWVSYIGTILSIICLAIVIITYLAEKNLKKIVHMKILINLSLALVGLYVTFFISAFATSVPVLCGLVSALMHYFFLAVFFWMAADAIHLHRKLVSVFKPDIESYLAIAMAICWVVPVFIVAFSLAPRYQNYVHPEFCRVDDYSFWFGLLVPFGIIYILNWIIFILILVSLLHRPNVRKETSNNGNLRQIKENFLIVMGLSILFGMDWAIGLLASSDLPAAVRYPAEWIFTLMTAFLGVYMFVLYVLRSAEARRFWQSCLLCKCTKTATTASNTSTSSRPKLRNVTTAVGSWKKSLQAHLRRAKDTSGHDTSSTLERNTVPTSADHYFPSTSAVEITSKYTEPSSVLESTTAVNKSPHLAKGEIELLHKVDEDRESINEANLSMLLPSEMPVNCHDADTSFNDNVSLKIITAFSSNEDPSLSAVNGEDYTLESKHADERV